MGVQVPLEVVLPILAAVTAVFGLFVKSQGDRLKDKDGQISELKEYVATYRDSMLPTLREIKDSQGRIVILFESFINKLDRPGRE